ncbi:hypothetical protein O181_117969 [Austropuccinia psidii MF-1]|uniref:Uncharacterized protein n=1 Tax=Austropuccinia psidii MF-1 TaxID=1389203 RepID=A0A9Q3PY09_9BASI|nr:hypothetical protein [Austropuccinia psidii MF-1]
MQIFTSTHSSKNSKPNVRKRPNQPHFICQTLYQSQSSFKDSIPRELLHPIRLNSLNRLVPYLGALELTIQSRRVLSPPQRMTLLNWFCVNPSLKPRWGQLVTPYLHGKLAPSGAPWRFGHNTFFPWPYPAIIGLPGQLSSHQPPGLYLCLGPGGSFQSSRGLWTL